MVIAAKRSPSIVLATMKIPTKLFHKIVASRRKANKNINYRVRKIENNGTIFKLSKHLGTYIRHNCYQISHVVSVRHTPIRTMQQSTDVEYNEELSQLQLYCILAS